MTGEEHLRRALRRLSQALPGRATGAAPGGTLPKASSAWEAWVDYRLERLEAQQTWLSRVILGALVMQVALQVLGMLK